MAGDADDAPLSRESSPSPPGDAAPSPPGDAAPPLAAPLGDAAGRVGARLMQSVATRLAVGGTIDPASLMIGSLAHEAFGPLVDELKQMVGGDLGADGLQYLQQSLDVIGDVLSPALQDPSAAMDFARATLAGQPGIDAGAIGMPGERPDDGSPRGTVADA